MRPRGPRRATLGVSDVALELVWVAAHLGLRRKGAAFDHEDAAPHPRLARHTRLWGHVHDITLTLGHPPAPYMGPGS